MTVCRRDYYGPAKQTIDDIIAGRPASIPYSPVTRESITHDTSTPMADVIANFVRCVSCDFKFDRTDLHNGRCPECSLAWDHTVKVHASWTRETIGG